MNQQRAVWELSESEDLAPYAFWVAIGLQALYLVGGHFKVPFLHSHPMYYAQVFAPAFAMVMARRWVTGFVYSLLASLVIPVGSAAVLALGTFISFSLNPHKTHLMAKLGMNIKLMLAEWITISSVILPAVAVAAIIRLIGIVIAPDEES
jgi:hypothetical protein